MYISLCVWWNTAKTIKNEILFFINSMSSLATSILCFCKVIPHLLIIKNPFSFLVQLNEGVFSVIPSAKFVYTKVYLYYLRICDSKENIQFCVQLIRAYTKRWIILCGKNLIRQGNKSNHVKCRMVFSKKSFFAMVYMIACFSEHLTQELWNLVW